MASKQFSAMNKCLLSAGGNIIILLHTDEATKAQMQNKLKKVYGRI